MASQKGDFTQGRVSSVILRLSLPIILAEMVNVLYNIVDRMFIGRMAGSGTVALTGIGISFPLISLTGAFANLCSTGGSTLMTIARGEGADDKAGRILQTSFTLLVIIGGTLTLIFSLAAPWLLSLLGGDETTLPAALAYFRIYALGTLPVLISLGMNPFINAMGYPRVGMGTVIIGAVLNLLLDPLFIYVLNLGVRGAALATVLAQLVSAAWALGFLCGRKAPVRLTGLGIDGGETAGILKLGVTGFTFKMTNSVTQAVVNIMLRSWGGALSTLYVGAMSLINSIREIMGLCNSGLSGAGQNVVSYNYGARRYRRVSQSMRFSLFAGLAVNLAMWALVMFFPRLLVGLFTEDEQLISLTVSCARIYFGAFPFMALQSSGQTTFVALNYPKHALFFSMLRKIVLVTPLTLLLPVIGLGVNGVFWAEFISQAVGASICFGTMCFVIWRRLRGARDGEAPETVLQR